MNEVDAPLALKGPPPRPALPPPDRDLHQAAPSRRGSGGRLRHRQNGDKSQTQEYVLWHSGFLSGRCRIAAFGSGWQNSRVEVRADADRGRTYATDVPSVARRGVEASATNDCPPNVRSCRRGGMIRNDKGAIVGDAVRRIGTSGASGREGIPAD